MRLRTMIGALGALAIAGCSGSSSSASASSGSSAWSQFAVASVDHVVDGDTLDVDLDHRFARVRTVQIDAPESSSTRFGHPDRCGAPARAYARTLTRPGDRVTLQLGGQSRTDQYGRLLAIVHLGGRDAVTWQQRMVRAGWAEVFVYHGNTTPILGLLRRDAAYARDHRLGVWARCGGHFHDSD